MNATQRRSPYVTNKGNASVLTLTPNAESERVADLRLAAARVARFTRSGRVLVPARRLTALRSAIAGGSLHEQPRALACGLVGVSARGRRLVILDGCAAHRPWRVAALRSRRARKRSPASVRVFGGYVRLQRVPGARCPGSRWARRPDWALARPRFADLYYKDW
jgi:hypothetical protein